MYVCVPCAYFILRNQELTLFLVSVWACRVKIKQVVRWYKTWFSWKSSFDKCNEFSTLILKRFLYVYTKKRNWQYTTVKKRKFDKKNSSSVEHTYKTVFKKCLQLSNNISKTLAIHLTLYITILYFLPPNSRYAIVRLVFVYFVQYRNACTSNNGCSV